MKNKDSETPRYCEYCRFASSVSLTDDMLCEKKGVVSKEYSCRSFVYDPLKRVPRRLPAISVPDDLMEDL